MPVNIIEKDYTYRRGEISAYGRAVNSHRVLKRLIAGTALLMASLLLAVLLLAESTGVRLVGLLALCVLGVAGASIWFYTKANFIDTTFAMRKWIQQICDGDLDSRIELHASNNHYKELDFHTRNLSASLKQLSTDMEGLVSSQTMRLEAQNQVVELLFKLTADVAGELDMQSVTHKICGHLSDWLNDANVAVYVEGEHEALGLLATGGPNQGLFKSSRPVTDLPEKNTGKNEPSFDKSKNKSGDEQIGETETLKIPIYKYSELVGMVEVIANAKELGNRQEKWRVFNTVSEQLSVFILKDSVLESAHNARLIKARTQLGAELHDSLAQTLLATGIQLKILGETISKSANTSVHADVQKIEEMVREANAEVRSLIGEYRKPLGEHRYAQQIEKIIDEFNEASNIEVFFQLDDPQIIFTTREDTVVHRIIGEALNNARKYSDATTMRVYIYTEASGARSILVEDDGKGFCTSKIATANTGASGDHIGLSIMKDRALSIGALLTIESELDEGTRVFLKLPPLQLSHAVSNSPRVSNAEIF